MKREWSKYINYQIGQECQLVTALNAYYYLTGKCYTHPSADTHALYSISQSLSVWKTCHSEQPNKYYDLMNLCGAEHGSAVSIEKVHNLLGLKTLKTGRHLFNFTTNEKLSLPLEINVWHKLTGYHSCLIVDQELKTKCIRIANFKQATSTEGWMFLEDLYMYTKSPKPHSTGWIFRLFDLKGTKK